MYITRKRLCCFCDGTGQDALVASDGEAYGGTPMYFTNVLRLSRAVYSTAKDNHPSSLLGSFSSTFQGSNNILQIVYYQAGVGSDNDFQGHAGTPQFAIELFGTAVAAKIRDTYAFIAQNYVEGDEIFLFGFSRGAYTARKVAGLIDRIGLLDVTEMGKFYGYCYALETGKGEQPPPPKRIVPIQVLGVWDTVGAIRTSLLQEYPGLVDRLSISDTTLPSNVKVALHAVSMHENRNWFLPTLFHVPPHDKQTPDERKRREGQILKEVWFSGEHSDVGGGWKSHELADIALMWMASEVSPYLSLDEEQLLLAIRPDPEKPDWGCSIPHNGWLHTPSAVAVVGRIEPATRLDKELIKADVTFHPSVLEAPDPSAEEEKEYDSDDYETDDGNPKQAGKAKGALAGKISLAHALGEHMISLSLIKKKFGAEWKPKLVKLNPLEERAREIWKTRRTTEGQPTYESRAQAKPLKQGDTQASKEKGDV